MNDANSTNIESHQQDAESTVPKKPRSLLWASLAAIGASTCCIAPLVLVSLGVTGAWVGSLSVLTPYQPIFITITLVFMFLAFRQLYLKPQSCEPGKACANPKVIRNQRIIFWLVLVFITALITFPWYAGIFA